MITTLNKYEKDYIETRLDSQQDSNGFVFNKKLMILESNWKPDEVFNDISVFPFLSNISTILKDQPPITVGHRHFDSLRGLNFYLKFPEGQIWNDSESWGTQVFYVGTHGSTATIQTSMDVIRKDGLMNAFKGFDAYPNVIFLGGCGIFSGKKGDSFGYDLLASSGTRALLGYKSPDVDFLNSIIIEFLFLSQFYCIKGRNPFDCLQEIYDSIMDNFVPAHEIGFTLYLQ